MSAAVSLLFFDPTSNTVSAGLNVLTACKIAFLASSVCRFSTSPSPRKSTGCTPVCVPVSIHFGSRKMSFARL